MSVQFISIPCRFWGKIGQIVSFHTQFWSWSCPPSLPPEILDPPLIITMHLLIDIDLMVLSFIRYNRTFSTFMLIGSVPKNIVVVEFSSVEIIALNSNRFHLFTLVGSTSLLCGSVLSAPPSRCCRWHQS